MATNKNTDFIVQELFRYLDKAQHLVERQAAGQIIFDLEAMAAGYRDRRLRSVL